MAKGLGDLPASAQAAIVVALIVGAAAAAFYYLVWPLKPQIDTVRTHVASLKAENDKNEVFRRQQTEYLNRIEELKKKLETLRSIVPDEARTDEFVTLVYDSGRQAQTWVRSFYAQTPIAHDFYVELPFAVHVDATYYSLLNYFDRLAHAQRIVSVTGLLLSTVKGGSGYIVPPNETVDASFVLTTYFNKPGAAPPGPPPAPH